MRVTGRVLLVAFGAVVTAVGVVLAAVGVVLLFLAGGDGAFGGRETAVSTPAYALVTDGAGLAAGGGGGAVEGTVRVRVRPTAGPVFVGVAPAAEVEAYLAGVGYEELREVRLSPLRYVPARSAGTRAPAPPEGRAWTVSASGAGEQTVQVPVGAGREQRLVVMNADGSAGVDVLAAIELRAPFLRRLALGLLGGGAVTALVGGITLAVGVRRTVRARRE